MALKNTQMGRSDDLEDDEGWVRGFDADGGSRSQFLSHVSEFANGGSKTEIESYISQFGCNL
ncbi:hypothetical protein L195_g031543 [Trifolium pratense]|uniref:Uncharacterized protein n=1 Tax=Trifolium pratense TaxID=57577 RepID=A0A2K3LAQ9_TRIPR|nr:hypothetical protein L195_g031543 [Trifolium pratense]